jgi:hypothetical protein
MPTVGTITARVLSGENVLRNGSDYRVVDKLPPNHEVFTQGVADVIRFVGDLKQLCDDYFHSQEKDRTTNYEDIAYVARQIEDGLLSEYENPALLPLNERFSVDAGRAPHELARLAGTSADYIEDVVRALLGGPLGPLDHLAAVVDAFDDATVQHLMLATLNHDLVLERGLRDAGTRYSDGFEEAFGTLRVWNDTFSVPNRKLLKLHGSIDWWRYELTRAGWTGQFTASRRRRSVPRARAGRRASRVPGRRTAADPDGDVQQDSQLPERDLRRPAFPLPRGAHLRGGARRHRVRLPRQGNQRADRRLGRATGPAENGRCPCRPCAARRRCARRDPRQVEALGAERAARVRP